MEFELYFEENSLIRLEFNFFKKKHGFLSKIIKKI